MRILYSENLMEHRDYADELLTYFVEKGSSLYSMSFISYNVHCLLHLTDVANYNRSLHYCSAYKFENNMGQIKRFIRGSSDPLIQVANRLAERQAISSSKKSNVNSGDYDQANQYISDYTTGVSAAEDSITYSMTDPAVVESPENRKRKNKLCDESDINSETSSCEEFHDLQQHHMTYKEITVQTRIPDDVHLKKSRNAMKRVGLKTKNVQLAKTPRYHGDCLDDNNESPDDSYLNSSQPNPVFLGETIDIPFNTCKHFTRYLIREFCAMTLTDTLQGNVAMHEDDHPKSSASSDLNTKILQQIQMLEQRQAVIMNDLAKVKSVLMKWAEQDAQEELFKQQQCSSFETFEAFCQRLEEDKNYRELYVHYLIHTHGSSNIGEMVRQALKSIASDNVLCLYNRTGKDGKKVLPPVLLTCLKIKSQLIVVNQVKSQLIVMDQVKSQLIVMSQVKSQLTVMFQVTAALPEPHHVSADLPEPCHISADLPEPCHVSADLLEHCHVSSDLLEHHHDSSDLPETCHASADLPESHPVTADHPESCHVLSVAPRSLRSFLRYPSLVSSVRDTPLVSARASGIPKSAHSSLPAPELIPLSAALPIMGITLWCIWAAYTTAESPEVAAYSAEPPIVAAPVSS
ncbi:hypothetical protein DPX16_18592 [Anabarilius grahami]|uniref:Uncharacterized protein n=1 Tax=Anabarilius grahami TaxID=495550 RepID=A0A3N0YAC1_ANAGA|nr:hypothetical protein DPX16_18592 [Anabarilius grahami]